MDTNEQNQKSRESEPASEEFFPTCQRCRFWESDSEGQGLCRRHAPRLLRPAASKFAGDEPLGEWPTTSRGDWCGEFLADFPGCWEQSAPPSLAGTAAPAAPTAAAPAAIAAPERTSGHQIAQKPQRPPRSGASRAMR